MVSTRKMEGGGFVRHTTEDVFKDFKARRALLDQKPSLPVCFKEKNIEVKSFR
jgi:hypothetical protein